MVFTLNIVVGFACSVRWSIIPENHGHHASQHNGSNEHIEHTTQDAAGISAHHANNKQGNSVQSSNEKDDDCCNKTVTEISTSDKLLTQAVKTNVDVPVSFVFLHAFFYSPLLSTTSDNKQYAAPELSRFSTLPDIRVSIQSFQI